VSTEEWERFDLDQGSFEGIAVCWRPRASLGGSFTEGEGGAER
jgi:hypothetical protein